jgi:hypothetical protein
MSFQNPRYPHDKFGFDGQNVTVGYVQPDIRSQSSDFIKQCDQVLKLGLMGGVLSTNWTLGSLDEKAGRLEYARTGKLDGRPIHKLRFYPKKSPDLKITLFFD